MLQLVEMFSIIQFVIAMSYARTRVDSVLELAFRSLCLLLFRKGLKKKRADIAQISYMALSGSIHMQFHLDQGF